MDKLIYFVHYLLDLYVWVLIASVIMSWLIAFNVINPHNGFVKSLWQALLAVTEPVLGRIRRFLPDMGGIDISPIILILLIQFIKIVVLGNLQQSIISIPATTG